MEDFEATVAEYNKGAAEKLGYTFHKQKQY
jgi:hypothetical protein